MLQVYPDGGLTKLLKIIANNAGEGLQWSLFVNDVEPDTSNELEDFELAEAWGHISLDDTDFVLEQVVAHVGTIQADTVNLLNDSGDDVEVYGYVVIEPVTQTLLMVWRDPDSPVTVEEGETYAITPVLGNYSDQSVPVVDGGTF